MIPEFALGDANVPREPGWLAWFVGSPVVVGLISLLVMKPVQGRVTQLEIDALHEPGPEQVATIADCLWVRRFQWRRPMDDQESEMWVKLEELLSGSAAALDETQERIAACVYFAVAFGGGRWGSGRAFQAIQAVAVSLCRSGGPACRDRLAQVASAKPTRDARKQAVIDAVRAALGERG